MPSGGFDSLEHWKRHAQQLKQGLLDRVHELSVSDYPETTANELIKFLQEFLTELGLAIDKATSEEKLRALSLRIERFGSFLEWLDNAHTGQTPRGLVKLLKKLINQVEPNSRVVVWPQSAYNYQIGDLGDFLERLVEGFIPLSKQANFDKYLQHPLKLISFPRIERDNILAHAIFGHELGHPIADKYLALESTDKEYQDTQLEVHKQVSMLVEQMLKSAGAAGDETKKLEAITKVFEQVLEVRRRALEELVSDAVGVYLFGPSAIFAFFEFLWTGNWDICPSPSEWYPPSRMRIRQMLARLNEVGFESELLSTLEKNVAPTYVEALKEYFSELKTISDCDTDTVPIEANKILKIAYDWLAKSLDKAISYAKNEMAAHVFEPSIPSKQLPELLNRLELGVPPNEIGDPLNPQVVDYRTALLAGWVFKIGNINTRTPDSSSGKDIDRLYMQTMRAIEYVLLQEEYSSHIKSKSGGAK